MPVKQPTVVSMGVIYKIIYPNGKIYIGQDRTNDINYFGSAKSETIACDFTQKEADDFIVRKIILERHCNITIQQLNILERKYIEKFNSNDNKVGYNRTPKRKTA